jgi:hypothetical protein
MWLRWLSITVVLVLAELWPAILESSDWTPYHVQYPCVIMQCQDWHYVLQAPGGRIIKVENNGSQGYGAQHLEEIQA